MQLSILPPLAILLASTLSPVALAQDVVLQWNEAALNSVRAEGTSPPAASRYLAILHAAMHDAINGIGRRFEQYHVVPNVSASASREAAGTAAAHDVLLAFYPARSAVLGQLADTILAGIPDGPPKSRGVAWGQVVARELLQLRTGDGSEIVASYPGSTEPGMWRPHRSFGGQVRPALLPAWGRVRLFAVTNPEPMRPAAPPALATPLYGLDVLITQFFGAREPRLRTAEQTEIAQFWAYGPRTSTPVGHWNQIAHEVAGPRNLRLDDQARLFALLNLALADAAILSWECKYRFGLWRPITAIPLADQDGNPWTIAEPQWEPLLETPPFPEYTSGHSTFSGAAAIVLARFFGRDNVEFTVGSDDLPTVRRTYRSFSHAAWESGLSRVFGGIHFLSANERGLVCGAQVGEAVSHEVLRPRR